MAPPINREEARAKRKRRTDRTHDGGDSCCAFGCTNARRKLSCMGKTFHKFPKEEERCRKWMHFSRRDFGKCHPSNLHKRRFRICTDHFEDSQYNNPAERKTLTWTAVPTLFKVPNPPPMLTKKRKMPLNRMPPASAAQTNESECQELEITIAPTSPQAEHKSDLDKKLQRLRSKVYRLKRKTESGSKKKQRGKGSSSYEMFETHPDWVPSLNLGHNEVKETNCGRYLRREKRTAATSATKAVTDLDTSTYQLSTGMEPNNSVLAGLKLEFDVGEDQQGDCAYTDDAKRSRGPDHSGSNYVAVSEQPSGAGFGMFGLKVKLKTETPDPDMTEAKDPLNIQVKKEPVSNSGDDTSDDDTEGCDVRDTDRHFTFSNSNLNFDAGDSNTNNRKENNKAYIENQVSNARNSGTKTSATSFKERNCNSICVFKSRKLLFMEKKFSCQLCSSAFVKFSSLKYHMSFYHGQKYVALAQYTGETLTGDKSLATKLSVKEVTAETQTLVVSSPGKNRKQHFDEEDTSKEFSDHHEIFNKRLKCNLCGKAFSQSQHLKRHQRIHTGDKPYHCTDCGKAFSDLGHLKKHLRVHTGDKPYQCTDCGKAFSLLHNLKTHQRIHVRNTLATVRSQAKP